MRRSGGWGIWTPRFSHGEPTEVYTQHHGLTRYVFVAREMRHRGGWVRVERE